MTPIVFVETFDAQDEAPAAFDDAHPDVVLSPPDGAATRVAYAVDRRRRVGRHRLRQVLGHHPYGENPWWLPASRAKRLAHGIATRHTHQPT
jgi:hypothetical protein